MFPVFRALPRNLGQGVRASAAPARNAVKPHPQAAPQSGT